MFAPVYFSAVYFGPTYFPETFSSSGGPTVLDFEEAITAALLASSSITNLVGSNVFPIQVPEGTVGPWVIYQVESIDRLHDLDGVTGQAKASVKFACGSTNPERCKTLKTAVYNAFDGKENVLAPSGITQLETLSQDQYGTYEQPVDNNDAGTYWTILEYTFRYREAKPS